MTATREFGAASSRTSATLSHAALFRLLASGFAYPAPGHAADMQQAFFRLARAVRGRAFAPSVAASINAVRRAWGAVADATLASEYLRLFSANGAVSLHEAAYGDGRRVAGRPVELADVAGFYLAFGLSASDGDPDLPDHLSAELEFISLLLIKESHAATQGWRVKSRIARDAAKSFLASHLGRWVDAFAREVDMAGASPPYRTLARLARLAVVAEYRRLGARPQLAPGRLPFDPLQSDNLVCPLSSAPTAEAPTR